MVIGRWPKPLMIDPNLVSTKELSYKAKGMMVFIYYLLEKNVGDKNFDLLDEICDESFDCIDRDEEMGEAIIELFREGYLARLKFKFRNRTSYSNYQVNGFNLPATKDIREQARRIIKFRKMKKKCLKNVNKIDVNKWTLQSVPIVFDSSKRTCGIYKITSTINGKIYVGQSICIEKRYKQHVKSLNKKEHSNFRLQADFDKYGARNFNFEIIQKCKERTLDVMESMHCHKLNVWNPEVGYNIEKMEDFSILFKG